MQRGRAARLCWAVCLVAAGTFRCTAEATAVLNPHHAKLYNSAYFSLHKTQSLPHMNLAPAEAVDTIIATRSFKNEIIVTCFDARAIRWLLHYARMAQSLGFDHFLVIGDSSATCDLFKASWCLNPSDDGCMTTYPGCGWVGEGLGSIWEFAKEKGVERLWMFRYHIAAELLRRGINVLMSDLDVLIHGDFYAMAKAPPLEKFQFMQMPGDHYPNGGLWYVQNVHPRGPIVRWIESAVEMSLTILKVREAAPTLPVGSVGRECSWQDQDVLKYIMATMARNRSRFEWMCIPNKLDPTPEWLRVFGPEHPPVPKPWALTDGDKHPPWEHLMSSDSRGRIRKMSEDELLELEYMQPAHAREACFGAAECARLASFVRTWGLELVAQQLPIFFAPDMGADPRPLSAEELAALPPVPASELVLHSPMYFLNDARVLWRGWTTPRPQPWGLVTHLVAFGKSWGEETGGRNNRIHLTQAHGLWHAPERTPERLMRLTQSLARSAAGRKTDADFRRIVHALMVLAAVTGRTPVLPAFPCEDAPWMERSGDSLYMFDDPHFISYLRDEKEASEGDNVVCAPYLSRGDDCSDKVVFSEFHLEQDLMYSSYSHATFTVDWDGKVDGRGAGGGAGGIAAVIAALRVAGEEHNGARVLFVGGDVETFNAIAADDPFGSVAAALEVEEENMLGSLQRVCPDFFKNEPLAGKETHPV